MRRSLLLVALLAIPTLWFTSKSATACSPLGNPPHAVVPSMQAIDMQSPTLSAIPEPMITRRNSEEPGCGADSTCTNPGGYMTFSVQASDDMTPPEQIGYRFTLAAGTLPSGFVLPPMGGIAAIGSAVGLSWFEGNDQEPFDFTLEVTAIDWAGNESPPQTVRVQHPGSVGGCRIGGRRSSEGGAVVIALAAIALSANRRRHRSR